MEEENDRIVQIGNQNEDIDWLSLCYEMVKASRVFGAMRAPNSGDIEQIVSNGLDTSLKLAILSEIFFPQLCSTIGRGLTLREIQLLVGMEEGNAVEEARLKRILEKQMIERAGVIIAEEADKDKYAQVRVPYRLPNPKKVDWEPKYVPVVELLLAPKPLVNKILKYGYKTHDEEGKEDGGRIRTGYLTKVSGPLPTTYVFQSMGKITEDIIGTGWKEELEENIADDKNAYALMAMLKISLSWLEWIKSFYSSNRSLEFVKQLANFLSDTYDHAMYYAARYQALNDDDMFKWIAHFAMPFYLTRDGLGKLELLCNPDFKKNLLEALDKVIAELMAIIEERACLLPGAKRELFKD